MPEWLEVVLIIGGLVGVVFALLVVTSYMGLRGLESAELIELDHEEAREQIDHSRPDNDWATRNGYQWVGCFRFQAGMNPKTIVLAWQKPGLASYFCVYYIMKQQAYDLVTGYKNDISLTTGSHEGSMLFPLRPFHFQQSRTKVGLDELLRAHMESDQYLRSRLRAEDQPYSGPLDEPFTEAVRGQAAYVRSIPVWWLRVLWWYAVKGFKNNRLVEQQFPDLDHSDLRDRETRSVPAL